MPVIYLRPTHEAKKCSRDKAIERIKTALNKLNDVVKSVPETEGYSFLLVRTKPHKNGFSRGIFASGEFKEKAELIMEKIEQTLDNG